MNTNETRIRNQIPNYTSSEGSSSDSSEEQLNINYKNNSKKTSQNHFRPNNPNFKHQPEESDYNRCYFIPSEKGKNYTVHPELKYGKKSATELSYDKKFRSNFTEHIPNYSNTDTIKGKFSYKNSNMLATTFENSRQDFETSRRGYNNYKTSPSNKKLFYEKNEDYDNKLIRKSRDIITNQINNSNNYKYLNTKFDNNKHFNPSSNKNIINNDFQDYRNCFGNNEYSLTPKEKDNYAYSNYSNTPTTHNSKNNTWNLNDKLGKTGKKNPGLSSNYKLIDDIKFEIKNYRYLSHETIREIVKRLIVNNIRYIQNHMFNEELLNSEEQHDFASDALLQVSKMPYTGTDEIYAPKREISEASSKESRYNYIFNSQFSNSLIWKFFESDNNLYYLIKEPSFFSLVKNHIDYLSKNPFTNKLLLKALSKVPKLFFTSGIKFVEKIIVKSTQVSKFFQDFVLNNFKELSENQYSSHFLKVFLGKIEKLSDDQSKILVESISAHFDEYTNNEYSCGVLISVLYVSDICKLINIRLFKKNISAT